MEQRPLRLGDLVDDYCPRERRITNHAIVAIVDDTIRQTRCTTCDAEHVFKGGKMPPRKSRRSSSAADTPVDNTGGQLVAPSNGHSPQSAEPEETATDAMEISAAPEAPDNGNSQPDGAEATEPQSDEGIWPANRTLIRATLPRTEGEQPPPRPIPEFTMHRYNGRGAGGGFRQGGRGGWPGFGGNGARGDRRQGSGNGFGGGLGHGRRRHGKKRPR